LSSGPRVTLGRVAGVFGVRGWVKVQSYTRPPDNLLDYPRWWIATEPAYEARLYEGRIQGAGLVARIAGPDGEAIADRDVAAGLIGVEIQVSRAALPLPEPGSYYWADLVGLEVLSTGGVSLGRVSGVMENGAQDVLMVEDGGQERLIPFVHGAIIQSVDLPNRRIVADWEKDY
jgi:16S rRNA processing protein RimM